MQDIEYANIDKLQQEHFWYRANNELVIKWLPKNKRQRILDAGCGPGGMVELLQNFGDVIGIDIHPSAIKFAKQKNINVIRANVNKLPFANMSFDLIVCLDVLYHKGVNINKAVSEFHRVLRPGGRLILRVPAFESLRGSHDEIVHTAQRFTTYDIERLIKPGFAIYKLTYFNFLLFWPIWLWRKTNSSKSSDVFLPHPIVNFILYHLLRFESKIVEWVNLPLGTSVYCLAQRL